jgi:O-antigen ligase
MQWTLIASAGFVALLSCYQVLTGDYSNDFYGLANAPVHEITEGFDSTRVTGPLVDPNYYAMILLIAYPIAGYRLLTDKSQVLKLLAGVAFLLIAATILFTYSRGGFLALVVVTILALRERKMDLIRIGGSVAIITVVMLPVLPKGFTDRMLTLTDILPGDLSMQTESSFRGRTSEALVATQMFYDRPILGVGRENYPEMYLDYSSRLGLDDRLEDREAHSMYLEVAAETGILGVLSFGTMLVVVFAGIQKAKRDLRAAEREDLVPWVSGAEFALVGYLIASIFLHADYARYFWLTVAFAVSTGVIAHAQLNQYQQRKHEEQLMRNELL